MFTAMKTCHVCKVEIKIPINRRTATYYSYQDNVKCSAKHSSCISIYRRVSTY
jgi:hypothetical protein